MRGASKSAMLAGIGVLVGVLVLAFSSSSYRVPLGTACIALGLLNALIAFRLRTAATDKFPLN